MDMPYSGTLTTILSGMEPAIAIVLTCIPLMRPIFQNFSPRVTSSRSGYNTGDPRRVYTKQTGGSREYSGDITELFEDDDNNSQIQLQRVDAAKAGSTSISRDTEDSVAPSYSRSITVKKTLGR